MKADTQHLPPRRTRGLPPPIPWLSDCPKSPTGLPQFPLVVPSASSVPNGAEGEGISASSNQVPSVVVATTDSTWSDTIVQALRWQCRLQLVVSAEEALDLIIVGSIDAVLIDDRLPEHAAMRLCEWVNTLPRLRHISVFILTGVFNAEAKAHAEMLGALGYLTQPCSAGRLRTCVMGALTL